jgi:hypothetical protein
VRRSLKEGLLGDAANVAGSRLKSGPFKALSHVPEFRDLCLDGSRPQPRSEPEDADDKPPVETPGRLPVPVATLAAGAALVIAVLLAAAAILLIR